MATDEELRGILARVRRRTDHRLELGLDKTIDLEDDLALCEAAEQLATVRGQRDALRRMIVAERDRAASAVLALQRERDAAVVSGDLWSVTANEYSAKLDAALIDRDALRAQLEAARGERDTAREERDLRKAAIAARAAREGKS